MGVLTGIVCNLIRSISSTPVILDFHVRESMALLRFSQICERFGMFFLLDLDINHMPCLPDIQELDDADVMHLMGAKASDRRTTPKLLWPVLLEVDEQEIFPIGEKPTWQAIVTTITDRPWELMRPWRWDVRFMDLEPVLGKLFTDFTCQMWLLLNKNWLLDPNNVPAPTNLQEAMECWSVNRVYGTIALCAFEACNAHLPGLVPRGRPQASFAARAAIFFPLPEDHYHSKSPWNAFRAKPGYLWQFHELMEVRDEQERFCVMDRLGEIFANLHCLPTSVATSKKVVGKPWAIDKQGKVRFVTNPMFYKILGLAESGTTVRRRAGPRAMKPIAEFAFDMYRAAGYDELVASQRVYLERRRLRLARERKSTKTKQFRKPPPPRNIAVSSTQPVQAPDDIGFQDCNDRLMEELFGPEGRIPSMEDDDIHMDDHSGEEERDQVEMEDENVHMNGPDSEEEED